MKGRLLRRWLRLLRRSAGGDEASIWRREMAKKVMVVDDEPFILKMIEARLRSNGYEVITAEDGETCLKKVGEEKPDVILLDIIMPGLSGFEVCARLKENHSTKDIPVVMLTALAQKKDMSRGLDVGAKFFVTKPYDPEDLLYKIKKAGEDTKSRD